MTPFRLGRKPLRARCALGIRRICRADPFISLLIAGSGDKEVKTPAPPDTTLRIRMLPSAQVVEEAVIIQRNPGSAQSRDNTTQML